MRLEFGEKDGGGVGKGELLLRGELKVNQNRGGVVEI